MPCHAPQPTLNPPTRADLNAVMYSLSLVLSFVLGGGSRYDWIASVLENSSELDELPESFFDEIREFRRVNYKDCVCPDVATEDDWRYENRGLHRQRAEQASAASTAGRSYRVDAAMHTVQLETRSLPTLPGVPDSYARVSVPQHHVLPDSPRSHDQQANLHKSTLNLSRHCVKGWGTARPSVVQPKRHLGLHATAKRKDNHHTDPDLSVLKDSMRVGDAFDP
eukprot:m.147295 g.147295  ORF g.147295 m.147295 type:complete len:223 (+) comp23140_c0_seq3:551-1219(+)